MEFQNVQTNNQTNHIDEMHSGGRDKLYKATDVAIIGVACKFSGTDNKIEFWQNLINGVNCIKRFPEKRMKKVEYFFSEDFKDKIKADASVLNGYYFDDIGKFDAQFFGIASKEAKMMDPLQRLLVETVYTSFEDAGYGGESLFGTRTGVFIGKDGTHESVYKYFVDNNDPSSLTGSWASILAGRISYLFNLRGPSMVIDTACSSGLVALHTACRSLNDNECDLAVAGGIHIIYVPLANDPRMDIVHSPDNKIRSFDRDANGTTPGEGVGALLLKPLSKALQDNDSIYAVIKGSAINNDGLSNGITAPNPEAQEDVIINAWNRAGIDPSTISYIESHGTGTKLGDPIEIKALTNAFERYTARKQFCGIGSVKTNIGHLVGAAGIAAVLKVIFSFKNDAIPESLNFETPNPYIEFHKTPFYVVNKPVKWEREELPRRAGVSSFGFSGTNVHVVLEEAPEPASYIKRPADKYCILTISAKSDTSMKALVSEYIAFIDENTECTLEDVCFTSNVGRGHYSNRLAVISQNMADLKRKLMEFRDSRDGSYQSRGIYYGEGISKVEVNKKTEKITESNLTEEYYGLLSEICRNYVMGIEVNWSELYNDKACRRINLPTYAYDRKSYWAEGNIEDSVLLVKKENKYLSESENSLFYRMEWVERQEDKTNDTSLDGRIAIFKDKKGIWNEVVQCLKNTGNIPMVIEMAQCYSQINENTYTVGIDEEDYVKLAEQIKALKVNTILHMAAIGNDKPDSIEKLEKVQGEGVNSLFCLSRALAGNKLKEKINIIVAADNVYEVTGNELELNPVNVQVFGLGRAIEAENEKLGLRCIDIDENGTAEILLKEIRRQSCDYCAAYRNNKRYVEELSAVSIENMPDNKLEISRNGVYIITGGTGGIGLEVGKYLAGKNNIKLVLISRTGLPGREEWEDIINQSKNEVLCKKISAIRAIEENGTEVRVYHADVTNYDEMKAVLSDVREVYGRINGVIHSAGQAGNGFIIRKDKDVFDSVIDVKVKGAWILDELTRGESIDFMLLFSSVVTLLSEAGQGDYTAGNSYLDALAAYRNRLGLRTLTINWAAWSETGMAVNHGFNSDDKEFSALSTEDAINALDKVIYKNIERIVIGCKNPESHKAENKKIYRQDIVVKGYKQSDEVVEKIAEIFAYVLEVAEVDVNDSFYDMGGDSILAVTLLKELNGIYPASIDISDIYSYPSVLKLADYIKKSIRSEAEKKTICETAAHESSGSEENISGLLDMLENGEITLDNGLEFLKKSKF